MVVEAMGVAAMGVGDSSRLESADDTSDENDGAELSVAGMAGGLAELRLWL